MKTKFAYWLFFAITVISIGLIEVNKLFIVSGLVGAFYWGYFSRVTVNEEEIEKVASTGRNDNAGLIYKNKEEAENDRKTT